MVAPAGGGNQEVSYTIKITVEEAKKALEDIIKSEENVAVKINQIKDLMIQFANSTNSSIEKTAATFKKFDSVFAGTTNSIIAAAAKVAKVQLLPELGPTPEIGKVTAPDYAEEVAIAQAMSRQKIEALQEEQKYRKAVHDESMKDTELERQQAQAVAQARVDGALAAQAANQKIADSVRSIITANTSTETKVTQLKNLIIQMAQDSGKSIQQVTTEIGKMDAAFAGTSRTILNMASTAASQQLFPKEQASGFTAALKEMGTVGQFVFGSVLGISAISALRSIVDFFKQATTAALEFNQAQVELQIGARATQRLGNDTTIQEYYKEIADIQRKYPIFSKEQATQAYSNALVLTRGLKLTKEQFRELIDVSASASIVMGRDFGETTTGIAKSLSSGWFEAAQRAGFLISRQAVVNEGLKMGIENAKHGYNAMTEYERAYAALNRYVEENTSIQEDVGIVMDSQAGKVKSAQSAWENFKLSLGQVYSALVATSSGAITPILEFFAEMNKAGLATITLLLSIVEAFKKFSSIQITRTDFAGQLKALFEFDWKGEIQKQFEEVAKFTGLAPMMKDAGQAAGQAFGEGMGEGMGASVEEAFQKLIYDIQDEQTKLANRIQDLWTNYLRKLEDITTDTNNARAEADAKYNTDVLNANIDAGNRRADAERKYRINELNAEAKFQEQLRQLRTKFLFNLEDALRERDARQVLRLTRQYQMDKENITKEAGLAAAERRKAFDEELRQIAEQRAERLRLLDQQHQAEIARIEQADAQKRADALLAYERSKADAQKDSDDRIKQQVLDFKRQYGLTQSQAQALVNLLNSYFGTKGAVARIYDNLYQYIMKLVGLSNAALSAFSGTRMTAGTAYGGGVPSPLLPNVAHPGRAKGGTFFATKPTTVTYGEAGPEYATFTPVSKLGRYEQKVSGASNIGLGQGVGGNLRVVVELSPDLVASIIDDTMSGVTSVVKDINRER